MAALGTGTIRTVVGDYQLAFWIAGVLCLVTGLAFATVGRGTLVGAPATHALAPV